MTKFLMFALFAVSGCAVAPGTIASQEESQVEPVSAAPRTDFCLHPTSCVQLCACDRQECLAGGGSAQQCGAEQTQCIADCPR